MTPAIPTTPRARRSRYVRAALAVSFAALLALAGGTYWLAASSSGLQTAVALAERFAGGRLEIRQAEGRLLGPLNIDRLTWTDGANRIVAEQVRIEWDAGDVARGRLHFTRVSMAQLTLDLAPSDQPSRLPADLSLPFELRIDQAEVGEIRRSDAVLATALAASFASEAGRHRVDDLRANIAGFAVGGHGEIGAEAPFGLDAGGWLQGDVAEQPLRLDIRAAGTLDAIELSLASDTRALRGKANATLTPFAELPISRLQADLKGLDPAAWRAGAPGATLDLSADLRTDADGAALAGGFSLHNRKPGALDRQRLPLVALTGQLRWRPADIVFSQLDATLAGSGPVPGHVLGEGSWRAGELTLDLRARSGGGLLKASGQTRLDGNGEFAVHGELVRFDPARFIDLAGLPAARLNASFDAKGRWRPQLQVDGRFELRDSLLAGKPLTGRGVVDIDGARVPRLDVHLAAGANRLDAQGAFGEADASVTLTLAAPDLSPYGLVGGLDGTAHLSGTTVAPKLDLHLSTPRFGVPGSFTVKGLDLSVTAGSEDGAPLWLRLQLAAIDTPNQPDLARGLTARIDGTRAEHTLSASARLADQGQLSLAATGGIVTTHNVPRWRGSLTALDLRGGPPERTLHLEQATPLQLAADGWLLGPAQVAGDGWQGKLDAHADRTQLKMLLGATGPRVGQLSATLAARTVGPWRLDKTAPWQASLDIDSPDLAWIGPLIGADVATGGRARVELRVAGTPAQPLASGSIRGEALAMRLPEQGLSLENGQLDATLTGNRLQVSRLEFDSPLPPPPRALVRAEGQSVADLATRAGHLEAAGEVQVDGGNLFLDVKLDRLGIVRGPDRWLAVSGSGRLDWRDGHLGLSAQVAADAGYWQLPRLDAPRLSDDVIVKRGGEQAQAGTRSPLALDVDVSLGRHFRFSGAGLEARLSGKLKLTAAGRDLPRASGAIRAVDGRYEAYGQKLHVERGILNFAGLVDNPALDVLAVRQGLPVTPGVEVTGTVRRPKVRLVSDPDVPDAEKLSWLVLGRAPDQVGAGDATVLLAAAGSLFGGESGGVMQQLKRNFGIDDVGVRTGQLGSDGRELGSQVVGGGTGSMTAGAQIFSVGKRLSANTTLTYEQALGTTESLVKLTRTLTRHLSLIARGGSDNAIDLFYTFTFGR